MFKVYWTNDAGKVDSETFGAADMSAALEFMNVLRNNPDITFVVMASENPNSVGKQGVAAAGADYNWTKRRHNERDPSVAVSRRKLYNANDEIEVQIGEE